MKAKEAAAAATMAAAPLAAAADGEAEMLSTSPAASVSSVSSSASTTSASPSAPAAHLVMLMSQPLSEHSGEQKGWGEERTRRAKEGAQAGAQEGAKQCWWLFWRELNRPTSELCQRAPFCSDQAPTPSVASKPRVAATPHWCVKLHRICRANTNRSDKKRYRSPRTDFQGPARTQRSRLPSINDLSNSSWRHLFAGTSPFSFPGICASVDAK